MKFYVQGPGPVDSEKQYWEDAILLALNKSCGMYACRTLLTCLNILSFKKEKLRHF